MNSLSSCLVQWVKSFKFELDTTSSIHGIRNLNDLSDGLALWKILRNVDPDYFSAELPEPEVTSNSEWTRKWQNLKHIERQVSTYYRDICHAGQEQISAGGSIAPTTPDLKAIAEDRHSARELEKLVMLILRVAMASPESNQRMVQKLMGMGKEAATVIATELREMEEVEEESRLREREGSESVPMSREGSAYHSEREEEGIARVNGGIAERTMKGGLYADPLLEREQELLHAQDIIAKLQQGQDKALRQIQELRADKDRLQEAFNAYRGEIESKGRKAGDEDVFKKLQRQADNDKAYIEDLESQMQTSRVSLDDYERQLQTYRVEHEIMQKLRDDMQMLRTDNEDLQQKIKANENLKKKIQTLQEQEKSMSGLREELKVATEKLEDFDRLRSVQASLEKEIIEKKGLIRNQEYQINELSTMRKHAEYDARSLAQKLQEARERQERDHEAIQELQAKLQDSDLSENVDLDSTQTKGQAAGPERNMSSSQTDENKHISEKLILMEKQLEAADARLRQAAERNAALEEAARTPTVHLAQYEKMDQQARDDEKTIAELRRDLQLAEKQQKQKAEEESQQPQDLASLQRENALMTSAWYHLSSRLQHNGLSLGRRKAEPKSWIGKQRALVGPGAGLVSEPFSRPYYGGKHGLTIFRSGNSVGYLEFC